MKGKKIHSQSRQILRNIVKFCEEEKKNECLLIPLQQATKRIAAYCGVSDYTVKNVRKEVKNMKNPDDILSSPGKHRSRPFHRNIHIEEFSMCAIRNIITDYYIAKRTMPSLDKLLPILREKVNFTWGRESMRRIFRQMSYRWRKCGKKTVMIENPLITAQRYEFLRDVRKFRNTGRNIVYINEAWVDTNVMFEKCWHRNEKSVRKKLYVVHACGISGFIPNALFICKEKGRGQITYELFEKWLRIKLIPILPPNSVVCLETAPHHTKKMSNIPDKCSRKDVMIEWLRDRNVLFDPSMRKPELFQLVTENAPTDQLCSVEQLLIEFGHDVIKQPAHHCDLNMIPWAWQDLKLYIQERLSPEVNLRTLKKLLEDGIESIAAGDFSSKYLVEVIKVEESYWEKDAAAENVLDQIAMNIGSEIEGSDSESSENDDMDSESEENGAMDSESEDDDWESLEKRPETVLGSEPNLVLGLEPNVLMTTVTPSDMVVELDPTSVVSSAPGPSTRMEPDSSMMEQDVHLAMTCEVYPADDPQPDSQIKIKQEPIDPDTYKQDILSASVMQELRHFSKEGPSTNNQDGSLFQPPVLIKEEPVSSEEEL